MRSYISKRLPYFSSILARRALDGVLEVEVDARPRADAAALVAHALGGARGDVARREVAEARVHALEVVVALRPRDLVRAPVSPFCFGTQIAPVVAQRLAHQVSLDW
jgi:hypothetical protein